MNANPYLNPVIAQEIWQPTGTENVYMSKDGLGQSANTYRLEVVDSGRVPTGDPAVTEQTIKITRTLLQNI